MEARIPSLALAVIFLVAPHAASADPGGADARALYDQGKFREALELLEKTGIKSGADYYNAANCHFRLGKHGLAYAYYQKADALLHGSSDIAHNMALAADALNKAGQLPRDPSFWRGTFVPLARRIPSEILYLVAAFCSLWIAALAFHAKSRGKRLRELARSAGFLSGAFTWAAIGALIAAVAVARLLPLAVVTADVIAARSGPAETFTELFKLTAGARVELTGRRREGWAQVRFSLGNVGWVVEKDLLSL